MQLRTMLVLWCIIVIAMQQDLRSQDSDLECGVRCLFVGLHSADDQCTVTLNELRKRLAPGDSGNTLKQLSAAAGTLGFQKLELHTTLDALRVRQRPFVCIAHLKSNHFVLLADITDETIDLLDPPNSLTTVPVSTFTSAWSGNVLLLSKSPLEGEDVIKRRLRWITFQERLVLGLKILAAGMVGFLVIRGGWNSTLVQTFRSRFNAIRLICWISLYCGSGCLQAPILARQSSNIWVSQQWEPAIQMSAFRLESSVSLRSPKWGMR
jgi:predicted double-glycine peptidase